MRRTTVLALVAVGAAGAGFAFSSVERIRGDDGTSGTSAPAGPQIAELGWHERFGPSGDRFEFSVERFEVLDDGWRARLSLTNGTRVAFAVGDPQATLDRAFGLRLFSSGARSDLEGRNRNGTLPTLRPAVRYVPSLPSVLEPHRSWRGTISAPGALVAGSWVRFVFGALVAVGRTPDELPERIVWTTDHAYRLRR